MIYTFGLQYNTALLISSSGTSGHLRHQLKSPFIGTKIRIIQHSIGIQNSHHTDMIKIQSLRHHLCTDKNIRFSLFKVGNNLFISRTGTSGIQIHTRHSCLGKSYFYIIFYLLRTKSSIDQLCSITGRTGTGQLISIPTIMASQLIDTFMISQTDITILTLRYPATSAAFNHRSKPTTVLKQNNLLFLLQRLTYVLKKQRRELSYHPLLTMQFLYINGNNLR